MTLVLGIDFGTSNSCTSYYNINSKNIEVIPNIEGSLTTPTLIFFSKDSNEILYGNVVSELYTNSSNIISNIKRLIGISYGQFKSDLNLQKSFQSNNIININNEIYFEIMFNNCLQKFSVNDLLKLYINHLLTFSKSHLNLDINTKLDVCITVPVYFNDTQRSIIKNCLEELNCIVVRILNEPTSAALSYAYNYNSTNKISEEYVLVIDCGGGTTDVSLLHLDYIDSIYQVKNTAGDNFLGGQDINIKLLEYFLSKLKIKNPSSKIVSQINSICEYVKKHFSSNVSNIKVPFDLNDSFTYIDISYQTFKDITSDLFRKMKNLIYFVLDGYLASTSSFSFKDINNFILVGGSCRLPQFKILLKSMFDKDINMLTDPDTQISKGAAIQGALINNLIDDSQQGHDALLLDVIPLTIGIETQGGLMTPIISRNTVIPTSKSQTFYNSCSFEESIIINIYQGERKFIKDNFLLASFELKHPSFIDFEAGKLLIKITFSIDANSIITAEATSTYNDISSSITIKKEELTCSNSNINDILLNADTNILIDSELAAKTLLKLEFLSSFKNLLSIFHEKREMIIADSSFIENEINALFNKNFDYIQNFQHYSFEELTKFKDSLENDFNAMLFTDYSNNLSSNI